MFLAKTGHAWEEANMHGNYKQNDVVKAMPSELAATATPEESTENDSDSNSNTAWEKAKEACKNVKDGIKSWATKRKHSVDGETVGVKVAVINENDATNKSWKDIKEKADAVLEASKEFPGVRTGAKEDPIIHSGMEKIDESGLLEPQHTLYNSLGDGADNIPVTVNENEILDKEIIDTGPANVKFVTTRRFSMKNENENDPHVYEATHDSAGIVDLLENADDKEAAVIKEILNDQRNGNLKTMVDDLRFMGV